MFRGLYANPNYKGQLLADVWAKVVRRTDTKEGQEEFEKHLKELNKKSKNKYKTFSYELSKMQFKCSSRSYRIEEKYVTILTENSFTNGL